MRSVIEAINVTNVTNREWRRWAVVLFGIGLFLCTWVLEASGERASAINAWIIGICLILVAWRLSVAPESPTAAVAGGMLGVWLLVSPFVLGVTGSAAAWVAWPAGAVTLAASATPEPVFDLIAWIQAWRLRRGIHRASPYQIARAEDPEQTISPQRLSQRIIERSHQIHRTLSNKPSETDVEMCALGYRACVSGAIKLVNIIDAERLVSGLLRRWRLELTRSQSVHALSRTWKELPPGALRIHNHSQSK